MAFDPSWAEGSAERGPAATVAAKEVPPPAGIPPALLERCMRARAAKKKAPEGEARGSADNLVLAELETKKAREKCVRSVIARHKKQAPKK